MSKNASFTHTFVLFTSLCFTLVLVLLLSVPVKQHGEREMWHMFKNAINMCRVTLHPSTSYHSNFISDKEWPYPYDVCLPQNLDKVREATTRIRNYVQLIDENFDANTNTAFSQNVSPVLFAPMFDIDMNFVVFPHLQFLVAINPEIVPLYEEEDEEEEMSANRYVKTFENAKKLLNNFLKKKNERVDVEDYVNCNFELPLVLPPRIRSDGTVRKRKLGPFVFDVPSRVRLQYTDINGKETSHKFKGIAACYAVLASKAHEHIYAKQVT